jgi:hypothetical protein
MIAPRVVLILWLAGAALGQPLAAQQVSRLDEVRRQVAPPVAAALEDLVTDAARRGLPTDPLLDKALEGTAKRIPPPQIVQALRMLSGDLVRAQSLLQGVGPARDIDIGSVAVALRRGAPPDAVRRLSLGAGPGEPLGTTVQALADLMQRGVEQRDAVELLLSWRVGGADPDALQQIPAAVDRLIRQGVIPTHAAAAITGAIRSGRGPGSAGPPPGVGPPRGRPPGKPDKP